MAKISDPKKAARHARVIASDLTVYPEIQKKISDGIKNDNLFVELDGIWNEALAYMRQKVEDDLLEETNILEKAFIDIVFAQCGDIESSIW